MAHRLQGLAAAAAVALVTVGGASGGTSSVYGTWVGTPTFPTKHVPRSAYGTITLVAGPVWVQVASTGLTGASHDAADATSTCTTRYRFSGALSVDGWRLYEQNGQTKVIGSVAGGPPTTGVCGSTPSGAFRDAVRLRMAGTKLRVEFGITMGKLATPTKETTDFDPKYYKSGYLHH